MSLQTGQPLGWLAEPIINPHNLRIVAFYVNGPRLDFSPAVIFSEDIREFGRVGAIVDSADNIMSPEGMVRLSEIINYNFRLQHILVVDDQGHKLGRVDNYVVDVMNFEVRQLYVKPSWWKSFAMTDLIIHRNQIIQIEPDRITVKAPTVKEKQPLVDDARRVLNPEFDNPFRHKPVTNSDR